ncbi:hypothetical protein SAMN05192561_103285 [Halopenitus malekzadehii]|uniref:Uncharacterized protein n=1 Tax=Halopenitus malekzadehii TaxID=1267564 RepID=A0A1H6IW61_9EURY|nr:hypothetical protein SAMN05192561_103285 [Halopenitus malekzadehii]
MPAVTLDSSESGEPRDRDDDRPFEADITYPPIVVTHRSFVHNVQFSVG